MAAPGLRGLLDVALLARSQPVDWQAVAERAHDWRVAAATWLVLDLADALFGLPGAGRRSPGCAPAGYGAGCWAASSTPIPCSPATI